jgi:hypothetical protein
MKVSKICLVSNSPSGFEIVNTRFTDYGDSTNVADYIDIRDRTNFYFLGLKPMKVKHSEYC